MVINAVKTYIFQERQIEIITNKVWDYIKNNLEHSEKGLVEINSKIKSLENKNNKLIDMSLDGLINEIEFKNKKREIDFAISELVSEKAKYNFNSDFMNKDKIKNHLVELGKNLNSKDDLLIKNILDTFIQEIIVYNDKITINLRLFPRNAIANDGGADGNRTRVQN